MSTPFFQPSRTKKNHQMDHSTDDIFKRLFTDSATLYAASLELQSGSTPAVNTEKLQNDLITMLQSSACRLGLKVSLTPHGKGFVPLTAANPDIPTTEHSPPSPPATSPAMSQKSSPTIRGEETIRELLNSLVCPSDQPSASLLWVLSSMPSTHLRVLCTSLVTEMCRRLSVLEAARFLSGLTSEGCSVAFSSESTRDQSSQR